MSNTPYIKFYVLFLIVIPVGTILHETGHYLAAKSCGVVPTFHYNRVSYNYQLEDKYHLDLSRYATELESLLITNDLIVTLRGVLTSLFLGLLGLIYLIIYRPRLFTLSPMDWIAIFLSTFLLRQVYILVMEIAWSFDLINPSFTDERKLAGYLMINALFFSFILVAPAITWIIGYCHVIASLTMRRKLLLSLSCLLGTGMGYFFWFVLLGQLVFP